MIYDNFIGIDIAKNKFDAALKHQQRFIEETFKNNDEGYKTFLKWLKSHAKQAFVCLESTGPYGELLSDFLVKHKIAVSVVNPMQIKHYAKSRLTRNKNDKVDARIIALYAEQFVPRLYEPASKSQRLDKEYLQLIDTLGEQVRQLKNQLESIRSKEARKSYEQMIVVLEKKIAETEKTLNAHIAKDEKKSVNKQKLLTIKGVGEKTANRVIASFPDIARFKTAKQLAAYLGLSPKQYQSGQFNGKTRISKCGDPKLRKALYMPAIVVKNMNPHFKKFCEQLEKNGLKPKQIICAVMRKLVHVIYGILKHGQEFNPALV